MLKTLVNENVEDVKIEINEIEYLVNYHIYYAYSPNNSESSESELEILKTIPEISEADEERLKLKIWGEYHL